jgi:hypothetical protein
MESGEILALRHKDDPVRRMIYFLSKPWKWQEEWEIFQKTKTFIGKN